MTVDWSAAARTERFLFEALDHQRQHAFWLTHMVEGCTLEWSIYNTIRGGGNLSVRTPEHVDWQRTLIRVWAEVQTGDERVLVPVITTFAAIPDEQYDSGGVSVALELHERTLALSETQAVGGFFIPSGQRYTTAIKSLLDAAGLAGYVIVESEAFPAQQTDWVDDGEGVTYLRVINDICDRLGYQAIHTDAEGTFHVRPYTPPGQRPVTWRLADDKLPRQRYLDSVGLTRSQFESYNQWIFYRRVDSEAGTVGEFAIALNNDPSHPYSVANLGYTRTDRRTDIEVASLAELQAMVNKAKAEGMADQRTFAIPARYIPVTEDEVVELVHTPSGLRTTASVSGRSMSCEPGATMNLTLREVTT